MADRDIPLLLARSSLSKMDECVDFKTPTLSMKGSVQIPLNLPMSGHICVELFPQSQSIAKHSRPDHVFVANQVLGGGETDVEEKPSTPAEGSLLSQKEPLKLHRQLGHASSFSLLRSIRLAHRRCNEQDLLGAISECGCHTMGKKAGNPFVNKHLPKQAGEIVFADITYPIKRSRDYPALLMTDGLTRFCSCAIMPDCTHETLVSTFFTSWIS